jgi:hypothetical protein
MLDRLSVGVHFVDIDTGDSHILRAGVKAGSLLLQADHMEAHRILFGIGFLTD